jgi:hypothetical protein
MRLIDGVHACDSQVWALERHAAALGITAAGEAMYCRIYGGVSCWRELTVQQAGDLEQALRRQVQREADAASETRPG